MEDVLYAYLQHSKVYYGQSTEHANMKTVLKPMTELYGSLVAQDFGPVEFKAIRAWWLSDKSRSRQYVNKQMKRTLRVIKWAVGQGMIPATTHLALKCVEPLRRGRCEVREAKPIACVDPKLVAATYPFLTKVVADMIRFQLATACRPGEVCKVRPGLVDRTKDVWQIVLDEHKTAYRGRERIIFVGPKAKAILAPYLLRAADQFCFSRGESEEQRLAARSEARVTPKSCGNRRGTNLARRPRKKPGDFYTTDSYGRAIKYACKRGKLRGWSPNQLRHTAATEIRKHFGLEAAQLILGHAAADVTQVYAERDTAKAVEVIRQTG
jgi:integrase